MLSVEVGEAFIIRDSIDDGHHFPCLWCLESAIEGSASLVVRGEGGPCHGSKCSQCLFQTVEIFGRVNVLIEHVNDALGHAGDVKNSKPEFYDVAHFLSSCSGKGKDLISFLQPWDCNLFKEIFVCDVAAIFGDPEG